MPSNSPLDHFEKKDQRSSFIAFLEEYAVPVKLGLFIFILIAHHYWYFTQDASLYLRIFDNFFVFLIRCHILYLYCGMALCLVGYFSAAIWLKYPCLVVFFNLLIPQVATQDPSKGAAVLSHSYLLGAIVMQLLSIALDVYGYPPFIMVQVLFGAI